MNHEEMNHEGYFVEKEAFEKLRRIEQRLHGGSDAMRDEGHKLWLVLNDLPKVELFAKGEGVFWEVCDALIKRKKEV